ncbi:hypothetical protein IID21_04650 [Patescibacteria group bacterium]|nr:hypothetical protein [Patescibacteria group bacterium]
MREVEGMICVGRTAKVDILYGRSVQVEGQTFEALKINGLIPFDTLENAKAAQEEISSKMPSFSKVEIAKIKLSIVENSQELNLLEGREGFIVLMERDYGDWELIGEYVEGRWPRGSIPGTPLQMNGLQPFSNMAEAVETAKEATRQGDTYATIAYFEYEEVENT